MTTTGRRAFSYLAPDALIAAGDFVSIKGQRISFLHPETLTHVAFKDGGAIEPGVHDTAADHRPTPARTRPVPMSIVGKSRLIKRPARGKEERPDMTEAETAPFHGPKINVAQLCDRMGADCEVLRPGGNAPAAGCGHAAQQRRAQDRHRRPLDAAPRPFSRPGMAAETCRLGHQLHRPRNRASTAAGSHLLKTISPAVCLLWGV